MGKMKGGLGKKWVLLGESVGNLQRTRAREPVPAGSVSAENEKEGRGGGGED